MRMSQLGHVVLVLLGVLVQYSSSEKLTTGYICLGEHSAGSVDKIKCSSSNQAILVTLVQYSSEPCGNTTVKDNKQTCVAYPTQSLADFCNGKSECLVRLEQAEFKFGQMGSNCNFKSQQLLINYECVPIKFDDPSVPKYDICSENKLLNPQYGFIHSPNYPNSYPSTVYCQMTLHLDDSMQRVELFLIDMETEALSLKNYEPTDYLEIDSKEKLFGKRKMQFVKNSTSDVLLKFRSDLLFSKRGFFLYFQTVAVAKPKVEIDFEEETEYADIKTTTPSTTTQTVTTTTTKEAQNTTEEAYENRRVFIDREPGKTELNNKTIVFLTCLIILLTLAILFLIFVNRNRIIKYQGKRTNSSDRSLFISQPIDPRINDTSVFNAHLDTTHTSIYPPGSTSINLMPGGSVGPLLVPVKLDQNKRISIDMDSSSMTHLLLLNATTSSYIESNTPVVIYDVKKPTRGSSLPTSGEVYDDISLQELDIGKKMATQPDNLVKPNEYCYIHVNGSIIGHLDNMKAQTEQKVNSENSQRDLCEEEQVLNTPSASSCATSSSNSVQSSPNHDRRIQVTSTPSLPKTQPPAFKKFDGQEEETCIVESDTVYQTCSETIVVPDKTEQSNAEENTLVFTSARSIDVKSKLFDHDDDNDYEYQVPTNIPNRF